MKQWWQRLLERRRWARVPGYRFGDAPTVDEAVASAVSLRDQLDQAQLQVAAVLSEPAEGDAGRRARLLALVEECAEVQFSVLKALQHGLHDAPRLRARGRAMTRRMMLEREIGDLRAAVEALFRSGDLRVKEVMTWEKRALDKQREQAAAVQRLKEPGSER